MSRIYDIDGVEMPSVTTVLDTLSKGEALINWAVKQALDYVRLKRKDYADIEALLTDASANWRSVKDAAMDAGSETHRMIEAHVKGQEIPWQQAVSQEARNSFFAFIQWEKSAKVTWLESERKVCSKVHGYAGTLDAIALIDGKRMVVDFKTSARIYNEYSMQIAAYKFAAEEEGTYTDGCGILRLDKKTGLPEWRDCSENYDRHLAAFLSLLKCYYLTAERRLKNNKFAKFQKEEAHAQ